MLTSLPGPSLYPLFTSFLYLILLTSLTSPGHDGPIITPCRSNGAVRRRPVWGEDIAGRRSLPLGTHDRAATPCCRGSPSPLRLDDRALVPICSRGSRAGRRSSPRGAHESGGRCVMLRRAAGGGRAGPATPASAVSPFSPPGVSGAVEAAILAAPFERRTSLAGGFCHSGHAVGRPLRTAEGHHLLFVLATGPARRRRSVREGAAPACGPRPRGALESGGCCALRGAAGGGGDVPAR